MERIFVDATLEQEQEFIEERRQSAFLAACQWPLSWLIPARRHKRAADILYQIAYDANERETMRSRMVAQTLFQAAEKGESQISISRTLKGEELQDYIDSRLLGDYLLLAGYALECILKGCLMARFPELVKDNKKLHGLVIKHNLVQLCSELQIVLSPQEQQLLELITRYITWGKYASPIKLEDMPSPLESDDLGKSLSIGNPFRNRWEQKLVDGIYQQGCVLLESLR